MKNLTPKEEEIMQYFWDEGKIFVKELREKYPDPKPHFNTLSTFVRGLEEKGFLNHIQYGNSYQYYPVISEEEYKNRTMKQVVKKFYNNSYLSLVNSFIESKNISIEEIKALLDSVEKMNEDNKSK